MEWCTRMCTYVFVWSKHSVRRFSIFLCAILREVGQAKELIQLQPRVLALQLNLFEADRAVKDWVSM